MERILPLAGRSAAIKRSTSFILWGVLVAAGFLAAKGFLFSPFPSHRHFQFSYRVLIPEISGEAHRLQLWIPLASSRDGQKVIHREISASLPYEINVEPAFGNEMLYAEGKSVGPLQFEIHYEVVVDGDGFSKPEDASSVQRFLEPSRLMTVNEEVKTRAERVTAGKKSWWEKARGIYEHVIQSMVYDKTTPGWGRGDTIRACLLGKGNCTDFHALFISIAHAAEIPARFKIGFTVPREGEGKIPGYHCWAEFFDEKRGWIPVDASEAWKHPEMKRYYFGRFDTNKFLVSLGRDIDLVPRQAGGPLNFFIYPYLEVDGKPSEGVVQTEFYFTNLKT